MKNLLMIVLLVTLCNYSFGQVKVEPYVKENDTLYLKTINFDPRVDMNTYSHTFITGYEYPTIQEGHYFMAIVATLEQLIVFYTELSNLESMPDGEYVLTLWTTGKARGPIKAHKAGNLIKINSRENRYTFTTIKMEDIKADLITLQALQTNK